MLSRNAPHPTDMREVSDIQTFDLIWGQLARDRCCWIHFCEIELKPWLGCWGGGGEGRESPTAKRARSRPTQPGVDVWRWDSGHKGHMSEGSST